MARVVELVKNAQATKSRAQGFADIATKWPFHIALSARIATLVYWMTLADFEFALERMVTVLIVVCPHALGLEMPSVSSVSMSIAGREGLLIRNRI